MSKKDKQSEERCDCGKLLFKKTHRGFEFKCNRCKRIHLIPFDRFDTQYKHLCPIVDIKDYDNKGEES